MNIGTYRTLFVVFLILTIMSAILMTVLFFVFDIKKIISIKTGYAVKKSIKQTKLINQKEKRINEKVVEVSKPNKVTSFKKTVVLRQEKTENPSDVTEEEDARIVHGTETDERFEIIETKMVKTADIIIDENGEIKDG